MSLFEVLVEQPVIVTCVFLLFKNFTKKLKMNNYSFQEMAQMHFLYGKANCTDRQVPCIQFFINVHRRFCEKGSFKPDYSTDRLRTTRTVEAEERVLEIVAGNPGISIRRLATQEGIPKSSVLEILHNQCLYPYHIQRVQALKPEDFEPRMQFYRRLRQKWHRDPDIISKRDGTINFHNNHAWADENPHAIFE